MVLITRQLMRISRLSSLALLCLCSCVSNSITNSPVFDVEIDTVLNYDDDYSLFVYSLGETEIDSLKHNLDSLFYVVNGNSHNKRTTTTISNGNVVKKNGVVLQIRPKLIGQLTIPPIEIFGNGFHSKTDSVNIVVNKPIPDDNYTFYKKEGFAILKKYNLKVNTAYLTLSKQEYVGGMEIVNSFSCAREGFSSNGSDIEIININVFKADAPSIRLTNYKKALYDEQQIYSIDRALKGMTGIEYKFTVNTESLSIPTVAYYGYKGENFFLIQLQSPQNTKERYEQLLQGIKIL